jgi:catechol 2,3-dioxygenase-like lactoylglutathione lyase family enzyme
MTENPGVFDHVTIRVSDRAASRRFYDTVLAPLGQALTNEHEGFEEWDAFGIAAASADHPLTEHLHVAFVARSRDEVDAFWSAGTEAGHRSDGAPGPRPVYHENYYGGFLLDPDGNSVEAVNHGEPRGGEDIIDHLWIRVGDLEAARRFWSAVGPALDLAIAHQAPGRFHVHGGGRSFALVEDGGRTRNVHIAFPRGDDAGVRQFHRVALAAGYRDNGGPGERPIYHPGYFGAFVLDPDGNNIEAVHHNR